jgi:hypothetical protein
VRTRKLCILSSAVSPSFFVILQIPSYKNARRPFNGTRIDPPKLIDGLSYSSPVLSMLALDQDEQRAFVGLLH